MPKPTAAKAKPAAVVPVPPAANFRSLVPGGFFSAAPFDLGVKRSIRTNNPGALNVTAWQKKFPGYVGFTAADGGGNKTTIYVTPEHGIAAWHHLFTDTYHYGETGSFTLGALAHKYAGPTSTDAAAQAYIRGWNHFADDELTADSAFALDDDADMLRLAHAMFGHEAARHTPLKDEQILTALALKRSGTLPME